MNTPNNTNEKLTALLAEYEREEREKDERKQAQAAERAVEARAERLERIQRIFAQLKTPDELQPYFEFPDNNYPSSATLSLPGAEQIELRNNHSCWEYTVYTLPKWGKESDGWEIRWFSPIFTERISRAIVEARKAHAARLAIGPAPADPPPPPPRTVDYLDAAIKAQRGDDTSAMALALIDIAKTLRTFVAVAQGER